MRYVSAAILLPAGLGVLAANGAFLTEAHDFELGVGKAESFKELAGVFGARVAEGQIVFVGAALIAEAFDGQFVVWILGEDFAQGFGVGLERGFGIGANGLLVVVEVGVLDAIEEILDLGLGGVAWRIEGFAFGDTNGGCRRRSGRGRGFGHDRLRLNGRGVYGGDLFMASGYE